MTELKALANDIVIVYHTNQKYSTILSEMESNKCRICLEIGDLLISLFNSTDSLSISSKIMSLANVAIHPNDGLPDAICMSCNDKLENCIQFIEQCELSDETLRNTFLNFSGEKCSNLQQINDSTVCTNHKPDMHELDYKRLHDYELNVENNRSTIHEAAILNDSSILNVNNKLSNKQQCFICGKIMSSKFRLKTHIATHVKDKPYSCTYCKKTFSILQNLNVHLRTHTGEKPFSCLTCGKLFAQSSGLTAHKRKHTGHKPYECSLCPRTFSTVGHLQYHLRRHTGEKNYECDTCSRAFITRSDLKQHIMTHTGDKPHICSICGIRLSRASNLKRHISYLHDKDKAFSCSQCPSKFIRKCDLAKHVKKHKLIKVPVN